MSPALVGGFLTTAPPGKSCFSVYVTELSGQSNGCKGALRSTRPSLSIRFMSLHTSVLLLRFGAKFCLGRTVFSLGWECLNWGICTGEQHKPGAPHNVRASSVQHLASNMTGSPGTTLRVRGSLVFGIGSSEQCVDWPSLQATNEGSRHLAQGKRRRPLPAAYLVLSKAMLPQGSATWHSMWPERYTCTITESIQHHIVERTWGFGVRHGLASLQCYLLAVWPRVSTRAFLGLNCLICKMEIMTLPCRVVTRIHSGNS